jgi:hypothetical protein
VQHRGKDNHNILSAYCRGPCASTYDHVCQSVRSRNCSCPPASNQLREAGDKGRTLRWESKRLS